MMRGGLVCFKYTLTESFLHFSDIDDADEQATGFYAVMGLLNTPQPAERLRLSAADRFWTLPLSAIFQDHDGA